MNIQTNLDNVDLGTLELPQLEAAYREYTEAIKLIEKRRQVVFDLIEQKREKAKGTNSLSLAGLDARGEVGNF